MSAVMNRPTESAPPKIDAFAAMHARLIDWGLCYLRGGASVVDCSRADAVRVNNKTGDDAIWEQTTTPYREADPVFDKRDWTQPQIEAAARLHDRVIALPIARSLVLQVFYFEEDAQFWDDFTPKQQEERIRDLTLWAGRPPGVNKRIAEHNRQLRQRYGDGINIVPPIVPEAFTAIRHRAIRELVARERGMPE